MKKLLALVLACMMLLGASAMALDYELKDYWYQEYGDPNQIANGSKYTNMRALFDHVGNQDRGFDVDAYIDSPAGEAMIQLLYPFVVYSDPMGEDLLEYWKNYEGGVLKEMHNAGDEAHEWATFVPMSAYQPENADKKYPVIFVNHGGNDKKYTADTFGFVQLAAKTQEFIVVEPQAREPEYIAEMIEVIKADYPVDMSRVYMTGDSMGGVRTLDNAAATPWVFAAIAPFGVGAQLTGTVQQHIIMGKYRLPIMYLAGDKDCYARFPIGDVTGKSPLSGDFETAVDCVNQWFAINDCVMEPLTTEKSLELSTSSEDYVKRATGIDFTNVYTVDYPDARYDFGEIYDADGVPMFNAVICEGGTHWHSAQYAQICWNFFQQFSRDLETGALIVNK